MRLLLADDHALFREALAHYVTRTEPESEVMLAKDLHEAMDIMQNASDVDLILLDLRMPGMDGFNGLKKLVAAYPDTAIALMSGLAERRHVKEAMGLGAKGYFPKTMSAKALLNGVHKILDGEEYIAIDHNTNEVMPSYLADAKNGDHFNDDEARPLIIEDVPLTPREQDVLAYLVKGASNKDIARALDLQVVTIKLHVRGICRKLGAKNRTQAALKAQEMGVAKKS